MPEIARAAGIWPEFFGGYWARHPQKFSLTLNWVTLYILLTPPRTHGRRLAAKDSSTSVSLKCGQTQHGCETRVVLVGPKNYRVGGHYITDV